MIPVISVGMKVRTITAGIMLDPARIDEQIEEAAMILLSMKDRLVSLGLEVQTIRLSTQSWEDYCLKTDIDVVIDPLKVVETEARKRRIDFVSIGPARERATIEMIPNILDETTFICTSAFMGDPSTGPVMDNIDASSRAILEISNISHDGSRNFMFAGTASVPPDVPFFPAAYHQGKDMGLSIGLESGDLVMRAARRASTLGEFQELLGLIYSDELRKIEEAAFKDPTGFDYKGMDLSFAPGLSENSSIALAIERITGSPFGSHGTLSAAAAITRSLSGIDVKRCGYSGLMLPILEDEGLARAADLGSLDLQKLLLYSSVCGTGLDAVPIPGNTPQERISSVLSDVTYLSIKWGKPLSARLLPIPEKGAGDVTDLNSPYLRDCSILTVI